MRTRRDQQGEGGFVGELACRQLLNLLEPSADRILRKKLSADRTLRREPPAS